VKEKKRFANGIVIFCLSVSTLVTAAVIYEYHRLDTVLPSNVLSSILAFFGGGLMILCLRQVLGSDVTKKAAVKDGERI